MTEGRTFYFVFPEVRRPVGGANVLLQAADSLAAAGYDTRLLSATPDYSYTFHDCTRPSYHNPKLRGVLVPGSWERGPQATLRRWRSGVLKARSRSGTPLAQPGPEDVLVVPEIIYPEIAALFPEARIVVIVQVVSGFARAVQRDLAKGGTGLARCDAFVATSQACRAAVVAVTGREPLLVPLHVGFAGLGYTGTKKRQIAYMPRKRPLDAGFVVPVLERAPELAGYRFQAIDRVKPPQVVEMLNESLIFLSLSHDEGFGLPAAEAMLAGCIVVGYTGVGGAEFLTPETGIVVPDGDMVGLIDAIRRVVTAYDADPAPLDAMRRRASEVIARRYSRQGFEAGLLAAWQSLDAALR